jgi:Curli production assembly/transport component CsgG
MKFSILTFVSALLLVACAAPVKVNSPVEFPAREPAASRLRHIAVVRFERIGPTDITPQVEVALSSARLRGSPYFTLVERGRLDDALRELRLAESGIVNAATASRVGEMVAAKGIYMGSVTRGPLPVRPV